MTSFKNLQIGDSVFILDVISSIITTPKIISKDGGEGRLVFKLDSVDNPYLFCNENDTNIIIGYNNLIVFSSKKECLEAIKHLISNLHVLYQKSK